MKFLTILFLSVVTVIKNRHLYFPFDQVIVLESQQRKHFHGHEMVTTYEKNKEVTFITVREIKVIVGAVTF